MYICRVHPSLFINRRWVYVMFSFLHIDSRQNQATNMAAIPSLTLLRRLSASTATELLRSLCTPVTTPEPLELDGNIVHISDSTIRNERKVVPPRAPRGQAQRGASKHPCAPDQGDPLTNIAEASERRKEEKETMNTYDKGEPTRKEKKRQEQEM
jgi:hypothetical protein